MEINNNIKLKGVKILCCVKNNIIKIYKTINEPGSLIDGLLTIDKINYIKAEIDSSGTEPELQLHVLDKQMSKIDIKIENIPEDIWLDVFWLDRLAVKIDPITTYETLHDFLEINTRIQLLISRLKEEDNDL
jgi:hypothetical protein